MHVGRVRARRELSWKEEEIGGGGGAAVEDGDWKDFRHQDLSPFQSERKRNKERERRGGGDTSPLSAQTRRKRRGEGRGRGVRLASSISVSVSLSLLPILSPSLRLLPPAPPPPIFPLHSWHHTRSFVRPTNFFVRSVFPSPPPPFELCSVRRKSHI